MTVHPALRRAFVAMLVALMLALVAVAGPAAASTESGTAATILASINRDRASAGLVALRVDPRLTSLASDRATWMAAAGLLSHQSAGGAIFDAIAARGVTAYASAEAVGSTTAMPGPEAAHYLYGMWVSSPHHHDFLFSSTFNYVGVGAAYRKATNETFVSIVFAESPDSTSPTARTPAGRVGGHTVTFTWSGGDPRLQTHTAGLRDFDVQLRVDGGSWRTVRSHSTSTSLVLSGRPSGHVYAVRVRDRDRRNNLSAWTTARTVRVR